MQKAAVAVTKRVVSYYKPFLAKRNGKLTTRERLFGAPDLDTFLSKQHL